MRALTVDEMCFVCAGSAESHAAGMAAGEAVGGAVMKGLKVIATVAGVATGVMLLSALTS